MTISTSARFDQTEGQVARAIEGQTAKLPSDGSDARDNRVRARIEGQVE